MHIIEKHSTQDGEDELPKAKKMKKEVATAQVDRAVVLHQRIDFSVAQRAAGGATSVTLVTISVKTEGASTSKPVVHPVLSPPAADMTRKQTMTSTTFSPSQTTWRKTL